MCGGDDVFSDERGDGACDHAGIHDGYDESVMKCVCCHGRGGGACMNGGNDRGDYGDGRNDGGRGDGQNGGRDDGHNDGHGGLNDGHRDGQNDGRHGNGIFPTSSLR